MLNTKEKFNISDIRADFPGLQAQMNGKPLTYLDTASSAQKPQIVIDTMNDILTGGYSNVHRGLYSISQDLTTQYEAVRDKVAKFVNADDSYNVVFTRNTTEAINLVAQSWGRKFLEQGDEIILTEMEHHANIVPWQLLARDIGFEIKVIPITKTGELDLEAFERLLTPRTKLVGVVDISNAIGTVNPVKDIITIAKDFYPDMRVLVDGTQAVVHKSVDISDLSVNFFTFTGHKLYGPTGIGALVAKENILNDMLPYQGGGDMIENVTFERTTFRQSPHKFEAGTPAFVEAIGLGAAVDYLGDIPMDKIAAHENNLSLYALERLQSLGNIEIYGPLDPDKRGPMLSFNLPGIHSSDVAMILDQMGIAVRTGHHCCMPLMQALGVDSTIRASFGVYSNKDDVDRLMEGLIKAQELLS